MFGRFYLSPLLATAMVLTACGGGGGSTTPPPPPPPADTSSPTLTISPTTFSVNSGETAAVTVSATDNIGVTSGPNVSCTNDGSFADGTFTAPTVTEETQSVCTVTASDAAGNEATGTFTATIVIPDTTPPTLSIDPVSFNVRSDETQNVTITAEDNVAVTTGPTVTCTNGGTFADGVFTAPMVTSDTNSVCTVIVGDEAGNETSGDFTANVTAPTGFSVAGTASKGLVLGAIIRAFSAEDVLSGAILNNDNAIGTGSTSSTDGTFTLNIDTTDITLGDFIVLEIILDGADMVCDSASGCSTGAIFGDNFSVPDSTAPASLKAIIPTPDNEETAAANLNIFTTLQSELLITRSTSVGLTQVRAQDLAETQTQISTLFRLNDEDFTGLEFIDIVQTNFGGVDRNVIEAHVIAGGVLGALNESASPLPEAFNRLILDFNGANGEFIGIEVSDDPDFVSLTDIFENAGLVKDANDTLDEEFLNAVDEIDFNASELRRSAGNARTLNGEISFGETNNFPPSFVTGVDYSISVNSTSFVQILAGDIDFDPLTFTLDAAGDGAFFDLTADGQLTIATNLDINAPSDADADSVYQLTITVSDGKDARVAVIPVTVTDEPATGFTLNGVASKGLLKGQDLRISTLMLEDITTGTSSAVDGTFSISIADNAFFREVVEVSSGFGAGTMTCDAPRGCGSGIDFGDDFTITDDQNGTIAALIIVPSGGTERFLHINVLTQLVTVRAPVVNDPLPADEATISQARDDVATTFNIPSQDYGLLEFVDITDENFAPTNVDATKAALISAGVLGAALEREGRLENTLLSFYGSFANGDLPTTNDPTNNRLNLEEILTHASEVRGVNTSQNTIFLQALDSIDADLAAIISP